MTTASWLQIGALLLALGVTIPLLGSYMARVFSGGPAPGDPVFGPVERLVYRLTGVDPDREQRWSTYAGAVLAFSVISVLVLYLLQRFQGSLPFNPTGVEGVPPALAFNTAVSFVTNTNWQNYAAENTMSHLTQMVGLAVQNFVSAAVGLAVAVALIRGLVRRRSATIGNFWVDLTRGVLRVLLPIAFVAALVLVSQGVVQNLGGFEEATTVEGATQVIPGGPAATDQLFADRHRNNPVGPFDRVAFLDVRVLAEQHRADAVFLEVERDTEYAVRKLEHLAGHGVLDPVHAGDAVADRHDGADFRDVHVDRVVADLVADDLGDLFSLDVHMSREDVAPRPSHRAGFRFHQPLLQPVQLAS